MAMEKNFENRFKKWLQSKGIYKLGTPATKMQVSPIGYYEKRWGGQFTVAGAPDLHVVVNDKCADFELKAPKGKPSVLQMQIVKQINQSKGIAYVCYENADDFPKLDFDKFIDYKGAKAIICKLATQE